METIKDLPQKISEHLQHCGIKPDRVEISHTHMNNKSVWTVKIENSSNNDDEKNKK